MAFSSHYHTKEWMKAKEQAILDRQSDPDALLSLRFLKDESGWFAVVKGHTRAQNRMVAGADKLIDSVSGGDNCVIIKFRTVKPKGCRDRPLLFRMKRLVHDPFGATYLTFLPDGTIRPAWLCNVTETVLGEHPKNIYVYEVSHKKVEVI